MVAAAGRVAVGTAAVGRVDVGTVAVGRPAVGTLLVDWVAVDLEEMMYQLIEQKTCSSFVPFDP